MKRKYTIINNAGLHARPASILVVEASKHDNNIYIEHGSFKLDLKSIMAVMSLGVRKNGIIYIDVDGENSEEILDNLEKILKEHSLIK